MRHGGGRITYVSHRKCRDAQRILPLLYFAQAEALHCGLGPTYFVLKLGVCIHHVRQSSLRAVNDAVVMRT